MPLRGVLIIRCSVHIADCDSSHDSEVKLLTWTGKGCKQSRLTSSILPYPNLLRPPPTSPQMHRVAAHTFRTARRTPVRKLITNRVSLLAPSHALGLRAVSSSRRDNGGSPTPKSPMYLRNFSIALVSTLVATGAWYAYRDSSPSSAGGLASQGSTLGSTQQSRGLTSQSVYPSTSLSPPRGVSEEEQAAAPTRRAVVVDNDQVYTGPIVGDGPLQKETDDSGRKVLEMLTPEQATQRLRRNEESYLVGRGKGVVRYDVVQIPSNNPIEDDHVEKIVEVPQSVTATGDGTLSTDWMFWGVFDGHR
jgi:pyruvate dehydrogenase phosphatase